MTIRKKNIAVLFGDKSTEHEVSVITGIQVINNIDKEKYNPIPIYIAKDGTWYYSKKFVTVETFKDLSVIPFMAKEVRLSANPNDSFIYGVSSVFGFGRLKLNVDVFFPCFHGGSGENGAFQGLFEICEKPYVGTEVLGSAAGMDKVLTKDVFVANNISTAPYTFLYSNEINIPNEQVLLDLENRFTYPIFVKPAVGGSSVGVTKATNRATLKQGLELAAAFDSRVIIEQGIENTREMNVSVMGNTGSQLLVSQCEEVFHEGEFLTYDDKYKGDGGKSQGMVSTKRKVPANISGQTARLVEETAKKAFNALNCFGLIRVDFLVKENPLEVFVIEVNTIPGSLAYYLWEAGGMTFKTVITKLIELAEQRYAEKKKNVYTFSSGILKNFKPGLKNSKLS